MFSVLRFILIVGLIFYYSPVRQTGDETDFLSGFLSPKDQAPARAAAPPPPAETESNHLETVWQALPESAKQMVIDKILTTSGLNPLVAKPTDTLRPEDRQPDLAENPPAPHG